MKNSQKALSGKLKKRNGFTLIEMLIVVAIIAILVVVSIPLVTTSLNKAREATDDANMRAAKAAAVLEYLGNDKTGTFYYDVENGNLVADAPTEGYNQTGTKDSQVIKVTIEEPAAAADGVGTDPTIKCEWVAKGTA